MEVKGERSVLPSITEVVMGIYEYLMIEVEETLKDLKKRNIDIGLFRKNMIKVFNHMLLSLDMPDSDITKPMTAVVF